MTKRAIAAAAAALICGILPGRVRGDAAADYQALFGEEARKALATATTSDDAALAAKLLRTAKSLQKSAEFQILLCEKAYEFGIRAPAGHATALEAVEMLAGRVKEPEAEAAVAGKKATVLGLVYRRSAAKDKPAAGQRYLDALLAAAESEAHNGEASRARALYGKAVVVAGAIRSPKLADIRAAVTSLAAALALERKAQTLEQRLERDPKNLAAREALILFYVVEMNKPRAARKLLTADVEDQLRTYVSLAARPVADLPEAACLELAAWYEGDLLKKAPAAGKAFLLARAAACYDRFLALHPKEDVDHLKAKVARDRVEDALIKMGLGLAQVPKGAVLLLTFEKDTFARKSGHTYVKDLSGCGNHGRIRGAVPTSGVAGSALRFDGTDDVISCGKGQSLPGSGEVTMAAWIRTKHPGRRSRIIDRLHWKHRQGYVMSFNGGRLTFTGFTTAGSFGGRAQSEINDGKWHHCAAVLGNKDLILFVDGKRAASASRPLGPLVAPAKELTIGSGNDGFQSYPFLGEIDEVALFNRALGDDEVRALYKKGSRGIVLAGKRP